LTKFILLQAILQEPLQTLPSAGIRLPDIADDEGLWIDDNTAAFSHRLHGLPVAIKDSYRPMETMLKVAPESKQRYSQVI